MTVQNFATRAEAALPALRDIVDEETRAKVIAVLEAFAEAGGWHDPADAPYDSEFPEWSLTHHLRQGTALVLAMARVVERAYPGEPLDGDALIAAGTLFDADKFSRSPDGTGPLGLLPHALWGAQVALEHDLGSEVAHAVAAHTPQTTACPATVVALLVAYADYIDFDIVRATRRGSLIARLLRRGSSSLSFDWV